jgi:integrase
LRLERPTINGRRSDTWYVVWTDGRRSRRVSTRRTDKVAAQRFLAQFQAIEAAPPEAFTVADLCDAYQKNREEPESRVAYPKAIANSLRHIKGHFGDLPPSLVSRLTVRSYVEARRKLVMDSTIDKELRFLRQALKFGVREKWMTDEPHIPVPGQAAPRQRFLTRSEFAALYFAASPLHLRTYLALSIDTLARGKHILALTWDRVDFERGIIWYAPHRPGSKKRVRPAPMTERLRTVLLTAQKAAKSDHVIEWRNKRVLNIRKAFGRAVDLSLSSDVHKHDLRRTGASWAIQAGESFDRVATLLGDTVEMTKSTYAIFSPTDLRGVVNRISME